MSTCLLHGLQWRMLTGATSVKRLTLVLLLSLILVGCDQLRQHFPQPAPADSIQVAVNGLPGDADANVTLSGPAGLIETVTRTETFLDMPAGAYRVQSDDVHLFGTEFSPSNHSQTVTLEAGKSAQVSVDYGPHREVSRASAEVLNNWREAADLLPIQADETGSLGQWLHAQYMVETDTIEHAQDESSPWYTSEGATAAAASNLSLSYMPDLPLNWPVTSFTHAPFHMLHLLSPFATDLKVGYYSKECALGDPGFCLDGHAAAVQAVAPYGTWQAGKTVMFPPPGIELQQLVFTGEYPDPLTACPVDYGVDNAAGTPLIVMLGSETEASVTGSRLVLGGEALEHCVFTASQYVNADSVAESLARDIMSYYGAIIIVPKDELTVSSEYEVTVELSSHPDVEWSFRTFTPPAGVEALDADYGVQIR